MTPSSLRSSSLLVLAGLASALLTGCGGSSSPTASPEPTASAVAVVTSTNVYGDIARQIGGDRVAVTSFIAGPDQDPHSYEANPQNQLALSKAKVIIENGGGYDDFMDRMRDASGNTSAQVLNAVEISGKTAQDGEELNEHVWYDLPSVARLADSIAAALGKADPSGAAVFIAGAEAFKQRLKPLEEREASIAQSAKGAAVAITEPLPLYLIEACGLTNATPEEFSEAVEEGGDVSPRVLRDTLALFTGKKVRALVYNSQTAGPESEKVREVATGNGIPVVPVTETLPSGQDYIGWMAATLDTLGKALGR
ncbi:metal ABC transporter substrate-binding protein [Microbispora rosea subsp. aerata]|nr:zinc ABC transporter substrate-binding protein [Microbispora rosea]GGO22388.1 metal ABC transporter substrate-binding protein [Microbispora rosea subsp. aerata]GIH57455.1 metal ABC transporter substrate-binding protein [Microbispora rosea subsp. aerata]GLJ86405.1 metal ABC transporter substrate-binding protein [Microbispora rosea subsp. aerata]